MACARRAKSAGAVARSFFFSRLAVAEAAMLEEGICDHRHERMTVKALPGSSLEVIETEFFFQLLVSLLANPSRLDGGRQGAQGPSWPTGWRDRISSLPTSCVRDRPASSPGRCCWPLSLIRCRGPYCYAHTDGGKTSLELSFQPVRQLMFCHVASASMSSAAIDRCQNVPLRGRPRPATGQIIRTSAGYTLR